MRIGFGKLAAGFLAFLAIDTSATVHYVNLNSPNPTSPYTDWSNAATNIQDAIDAADSGDQILVTNGVYQSGSRVVYGSLTNRVAVTKPVAVCSVNGPGPTVIRGYQVPSSINGDGAVRCVYLTNGAVLAGFTLTNGATRTAGDSIKEQCAGGVWCESTSATVSNCVLRGNSAYYNGGGAYSGTLINCTLSSNSTPGGGGGGAYYGTLNGCTLSGNSAFGGGGAFGDVSVSCTLNGCILSGNTASGYGGGAYYVTLNNCALSTNSAPSGGGANNCTLNGCTLTRNSASSGGGAFACKLNNCALSTNSASYGGGAYSSTLNNCLLTGNSASTGGGGAYSGTLNNCALTGNSASTSGGGAYSCTLNNCTLTGNSATSYGGGGIIGTLKNCILYSNTAPSGSNFYSGALTNCCTIPLPPGTGNFTNAPLFVSLPAGNLRLQTNSPCINAGNNSYAVGSTDLDGRPRIVGSTVDVGAYEFQGAGVGEFIAWLRQYGLPADGSADHLDSDGDGMDNWREWVAGTNPTNTLSVLELLALTGSLSGVTVTWQSVSNRTYFLERSTNLGALPCFLPLVSNVLGQAGTTTYTDSDAMGGAFFYRVGVQ